MLKLKMMLCVMMLPLVVVGCTSYSPSVSAKPPPPGADNAASPDRQTTLIRIISLRREADHYAKTTEGTQKYINEQCRRIAHIDGQLMQLL